MKNALGANIILAQKSPQSGVIGVIGVYIWNHPILGCFYKESCINSPMSSMVIGYPGKSLVPHLVPHMGYLGYLYQKYPTLGYMECDLISPYLILFIQWNCFHILGELGK